MDDSLKLLVREIVKEAKEESFANSVLAVNPYNAMGYGLSLLIVIMVAIIFYRRWLAEHNYGNLQSEKILEFNQHWLEFMIMLKVRFDDSNSLLNNVEKTHDDMIKKMDALITDIKFLSRNHKKE